ncbi:MAG TPA: glycoside hydrolase family 3 C-terminal domain-containing protein [Candidatus Lokiarchaeia archaeon]|nr:glycoside hydrolase family 3 C-terminal domain-containing protein [Candidatus Lokiarchaeia archaeon]
MTLDWNSLSGLESQGIDEKAREILGLMTLQEKVKQLSGDVAFLSGKGPKLMLRYNYIPIPAGENKRLGIPPVAFTDGPRGIVMGSSTCFPVSMARGATWDPGLEERVGEVIGTEARAQGANYFGGVCINLLRHPAWGRAQESYGEDPVLLGAMGAALVRGVQSTGVMACAKHFALNSMENMRFKIDVTIDERALREIYLPHFKKCVDAGVASIMGAYNKVNGEQCCQHKHLLRDILKDEWNFQGFVISDFIFGVRDGIAAINGGLDIEMPFKMHMKPGNLLKAIKRCKITETLIDDSVLRILRQKLRFNLPDASNRFTRDKVACPEHEAVALEVARKSIVLLKNDGSLLPLAASANKNVAVIGRLAKAANIGDHGSSRVRPPHVITPWEGITANVKDSCIVSYHDGKNVASAVATARIADAAIIFAGMTWKNEGEYLMSSGGDRNVLSLSRATETLIESVAAANPRTIVVLEGGSAIITENWREHVPAILMAWYPGMEGGTAIAEVLFGNVNPSGRLPCVFPKTPDQLPFFDKHTRKITYDSYHGYRLMDKKGHEPAFSFGFGLGYTTFKFNNVVFGEELVHPGGIIDARVDVTNTGTITGEETVQTYVGCVNSAVDRPVKELKGFDKVVLEPAETRTVVIEVPASDLAYYDVVSRSWTVEPAKYQLFVGSSSSDKDLLATSFQVG